MASRIRFLSIPLQRRLGAIVQLPLFSLDKKTWMSRYYTE